MATNVVFCPPLVVSMSLVEVQSYHLLDRFAFLDSVVELSFNYTVVVSGL